MKTYKLTRLALLASLMLILGYIERSLPLFPAIPAIKIGLANSILLYALLLIDIKSACLLMLVKVLLGGLMFLNPVSILFSAIGSIFSLVTMIMAIKVKGFSTVGISIVGSCFHMIGQIIASRWILGTWGVLVQAPLLLISAIIMGFLTGYLAKLICNIITKKMQDSFYK